MAGRQIANLQGLWGAAAFLIVLYHIQPLLNRVYGQSLHSHFAVFGVDIFFVLSGFVMFYGNPEPKPSAAARFPTQRPWRIVPLYWLATAAILAFFAVGFRPVGLHHISPRIVIESLAFLPSTFPDGRHDLIRTVGWTLMFELFFYLAFALTFALRSLEKSFLALAGLFLALCVWGQVAGPLPWLIDFYTSSIMLEFLYGAVLGILYLRWSGRVPGWLPLAGLALLLAGFVISIAQDLAGVVAPHKRAARFLIFGGPALLVVAGALAMERGGWILKQRFLLELGTASYALYLFNPLVLQIVVKALDRVSLASPVVAGLLAVGFCVAAAFEIHRLVEQPLLDAVKRHRRTASARLQTPAPALVTQPAE